MDWLNRHSKAVDRMTLLTAEAARDRKEAALHKGLQDYLNPKNPAPTCEEYRFSIPIPQEYRVQLRPPKVRVLVKVGPPPALNLSPPKYEMIWSSTEPVWPDLNRVQKIEDNEVTAE